MGLPFMSLGPFNNSAGIISACAGNSESFSLGKVYMRIRDAVGQGAEQAVLDLSCDTVTLDDTIKKAREAIADGVIAKSRVIIIDWHGAEHLI
jgi:hypothetical protein